MTSKNDPIIMYDFTCPICYTVFHGNRAEPFCEKQHPGTWHLQGMHLSEEPCKSCLTWVDPLNEEIAEWKSGRKAGRTDGLMFPPPGACNSLWMKLWKATPVTPRKKRAK